MLSNSTKSDGPAGNSEAELRRAAQEARAAVAAAPGDEAAAVSLREAVQEYQRAFPRQRPEPRDVALALTEARRLIDEGDLEPAEVMLRKHLADCRNDPPAMHMMAEIAAYCGLREDAERILDRSAFLNGDSPDTLVLLAATLHLIAYREDIPEFIFKAARVLERALELDPRHEGAMSFKASMMMQTRGLEQARSTYEQLIELSPQVPLHWINYGSLLNALGQWSAALAAYRTALALDPANGENWWILADLKKATLFPSDIAQMTAALADEKLPEQARIPMHFAMAKAFDAAGEYRQSIANIEQGSEIHRRLETNPPESIIRGGEFIRRTFTPEFFAQRSGWGDPRPGPIFIVGMHRAGSTLVEQILSSHSQIEGTEELFILSKFSRELALASRDRDPGEVISELGDEDFRSFAERYLETSGRSRQTDRPYLTDKFPGNWQYVGLIHLMFPNAKIIDVRRNPMDCCFANYTRHYGKGVNYSYGQREMGRQYCDYVATMRHFDAVLPGRVYRLIHDDLVDNFEGELRGLLEYIGVPFEEGCLQFFQTDRPVHTPSAEQVREPINRKGFGRWRNYEPWLTELQESLADVMDDWRR